MKNNYNKITQEFQRMCNIVAKTFSKTMITQFNRNQSILQHYKLNLHHLYSHYNRSLFSILFMLFAFVLFLLNAGCEKVIDVDLSESEPAIVVEGNLSFGGGELEVKVSKTGSYFSNDSIEKVKNAEVYLENGPAYRLKAEETGNGVYKLTGLPANPNSTYRLTVKVNDEEYTGVSELNPTVKLDSMNYEYLQEQVFFDGGYRALLYFNDPPGVENYYRVKVYRNGELFNSVEDIVVFDDSSFNGKGLKLRLRGQRFEKGDTVRAELLSIDRNTWEYFTTLNEIANLNPGSPSPANPISNLTNGALGYFSVWALSSGEIVIPEQ